MLQNQRFGIYFRIGPIRQKSKLPVYTLERCLPKGFWGLDYEIGYSTPHAGQDLALMLLIIGILVTEASCREQAGPCMIRPVFFIISPTCVLCPEFNEI